MSRGLRQRELINFDKVFAPVAKIETIYIDCCFTNINNWSMCKMDVKRAFFNDPLDEDVYASQLVGFKKQDQENKVYKLHQKIDRFLREMGFVKCTFDHGVYVGRRNTNKLIILCLFVDDLLIICNR